jgi:hypothetical protein
LRLRDQVNARWPNRSKGSDGIIGDRAHAARASDHNPVGGIVHAIDITHSPGKGLDVHAMAERMRQSKDPRIKYMISNRRIASSANNWAWRRYTGSNPHSGHLHLSVHRNPHADSTKDWRI